jgi:hypothetical protein
MEPKKKMGRPSQGKVGRRYTLSKGVVEYLDSLPDGERSRFVNEAVAEKIEKVNLKLDRKFVGTEMNSGRYE